MNTITVTLSDERLSELKEKADELGLTPEELVRVSIEELLSRPEDAFRQAVEYVLKKNKVRRNNESRNNPYSQGNFIRQPG